MTVPFEVALADPATPLGTMQRGRGASLLWARRHREEARGFLLECITRDPRWDRQIESRERLYWEIARVVDLAPTPIADFLNELEPDEPGENSDEWLAFGVLGLLAADGDSVARATLREQVASGRLWNAALDELEAHEDLWPGVDELLVARLTDSAFADGLRAALYGHRLEGDSWRAWRARQPELERIAREVFASEAGSDYDHPAAALPTAELLHHKSPSAVRVLATRTSEADVALLWEAARGEDSHAKGIALHALGRQKDPNVLEEVIEVLRRHEVGYLRGAAHLSLRALPPELTLAEARKWFVGEPSLRTAGEIVLEHYGEPQDVPVLSAELQPALSSGDMYRLCSILKALLRLADEGPFPDVELAFAEVPYSYARIRAASLLKATSESFARTWAYECLWDCEEETRAIGAAAVDSDMPGAAERIKLLSEEGEQD